MTATLLKYFQMIAQFFVWSLPTNIFLRKNLILLRKLQTDKPGTVEEAAGESTA